MSDITVLMQQVAAQLQQEGKTPSLALFRARLAGQLAPQQLFAAYQHWRNNPLVSTDLHRQPAPVAVAEHVTEDLAVSLARIEAKLDRLLSKLDC